MVCCSICFAAVPMLSVLGAQTLYSALLPFPGRMRWTVRGIPRVPWNAEGIFDGVSTFRVDGTGKIYEHQVRRTCVRECPFLRAGLMALNRLLALQIVRQLSSKATGTPTACVCSPSDARKEKDGLFLATATAAQSHCLSGRACGPSRWTT